MLVLVLLLAATNLVSLGVLAWYLLRPIQHPSPDAALAASIAARHPGPSTSATRRVITIEILNVGELAAQRGRWVGLAASLAPGITRRVVHDQAIKIVRRQLAKENVIADVRLHMMRPDPPGTGPRTPPAISRIPPAASGPDLVPTRASTTGPLGSDNPAGVEFDDVIAAPDDIRVVRGDDDDRP